MTHTIHRPPGMTMTKTNTHRKYKDKDARNSSVPVLMYIGCNALWLISYAHQYKDKDKDKVLKRHNMCYIFEKQKVQGYQI